MSQSQWKQFVQLFSEKNKHLTKKQVLQMAKKPFQQLKKHYQQQRGGGYLEGFLDELESGDQISNIYLEGEHISTPDAQFIAVALSTPVRTFTLVNCTIEPKGKTEIFQELGINDSIEYVCFENCGLTDSDIVNLVKSLKRKHHSISVLNVDMNDIGEEGIAALRELQEMIPYLKIDSRELTGGNPIFRFRVNEYIRLERAHEIIEMFSSNPIHSATFVNCDMDKDAKEYLFDELAGNRSIRYLRFENCMLKDADFTQLADVLSVNGVIDVVNLEGNITSGDGVAKAAVEKIRADHRGRIVDY